ncbi:SDR family NAD(P)-dependent oxidoreductase [Amycolatopsis sp., V23-08]|uniref:SDR family NAD(P)-dependent oxidoreductase n=1 Tax=Amycolatopsis heterodermiae TaxID=3110235 RepID=A0ABU5RMM2_9PSEU|nr:SDR family NAD(P)-dependent oxidoreductase [Amycolatopsis sp., V23-08]MEA5366745.1 SDR family NAD(P)-dependent oxidoreductase [Amycolatopsis sp., V23-08]
MSGKTWIITGASRGFGREWTEAALERGDRVAALSRSDGAFDDLVERHGDTILPLKADVTDREGVTEAVQRAADHFGGLDIVVNNAGYGLFGMVEEVTERQARDQVEVNLLGPLWVTQAALPHLRARGGGHIVQVSSVAGVYSLPGLGIYHASKFGLEGFTASLAAEVKDFGIKVTLVEPAGYATDWAGPSAVHAERSPVYDGFRAAMSRPASTRGEPSATRGAILRVVDAEEPPLRIFFGPGPLPLMKQEYAARLAEWERWDDVSHAAFGASH